MLDQIEYKIAKKLSEFHHYPFAQNNYINIFKAFSHFPLKLSDVGVNSEGKTITFMSLVVLRCFEKDKQDFPSFFQNLLKLMKQQAAPFFPQDITVETYLGCVLFYYHPSQIRNALSIKNMKTDFNDKQLYEFDFKKKTILIFTL